MSDLTVTVPETLYVGVQGRKAFCTDTYPLAFATPAGTDKAFDKRKTTVDNWVGAQRAEQARNPDGTGITETVTYEQVTGYNPTRTVTRSYERPVMAEIIPDGYEAQVIKNEPIEGFFFDKSVSRWRTQNKWFAINDPRGFQLQITAENLGDILINNGVVNGDLQGKYVWARSGGKVYLIGETHPAYIKAIKPSVVSRLLKAGDKFLFGSEKKEALCLGVVYAYEFDVTSRYFRIADNEIQPARFYPPYRPYYGVGQHPEEYVSRQVTIGKKDMKPYILYQILEGYSSGGFALMRNTSKAVINSENNPVPEVPDIFFNRAGYKGCAKVFLTKQELADFDNTTFNHIDAYIAAYPYGNSSINRNEVRQHISLV